MIDVAYAARNWADTQKRRGTYPRPIDYPARPGLEVSGRIASVGQGVRGIRPGDRVAAITGEGGYAEQAVAAADCTIVLPDSVLFKLGAAFPIVSLTAYHLLHSAYRLRPNRRPRPPSPPVEDAAIVDSPVNCAWTETGRLVGP